MRKVCVITGATSGIGRALARRLGTEDAALVLLGRNESAGQALVRSIRRRGRAASADFIRIDLADQTSVHTAAREITNRHSCVDVLINNAGARFDRFALSADGIELTFATNHLGHFLLTSLLLESIARAVNGRMVNIASSAAAQARSDGGWVLEAANFDRKQAYAKSKLANILFSFESASRVRGTTISTMAVDPGIVATRFARNNGLGAWLKHLVYHGLRRELVSAVTAARSIAQLALASVVVPENGYFRGNTPAKACPAAYDPAAAASLWALSLGLIRSGPDLDEIWNRIGTPK
jgi:NAD(P)-dependent dehydrogenase (short-subunit alcohol dehydrogenase family)